MTGKNRLHSRGEYEVQNGFVLRAGTDNEHWSAGAGIRIAELVFDYAFVSFDLGNSHRISGNIQF